MRLIFLFMKIVPWLQVFFGCYFMLTLANVQYCNDNFDPSSRAVHTGSSQKMGYLALRHMRIVILTLGGTWQSCV